MYDTWFVYQSQGDCLRLEYSVADDGTVVFAGDPVDVIPTMTYPDAPMEAAAMGERKIPQSEIDTIPSSQFAGKNKSFPIVTPADVKAAARSMGRAGADNYDAATLKANIIKIAKRMGKTFMTMLPAAWKKEMGMGESSPVDIETGALKLIETDLTEAGTALIKLIEPGWGSSGFYSRDLLKKSASVFSAGTKMYLDHQTAAEEAARPEGSVTGLGGELLEDAQYLEHGASGPGLYARAKIFDHFRPMLSDIKDSIGVSIRARGTTKTGVAEGRKGVLVEEISSAKSVDFVTMPGAGGKVAELYESRRQKAGDPVKESTMTDTEIKSLQESKAKVDLEVARLRETVLQGTARAHAEAKLKIVEMPAATRERLVESLQLRAVMAADGAIDTAKFDVLIAETVKEELAYIEKITGGGTVRGFGGSTAVSGGGAEYTEAERDANRKQLAANFSALTGLGEKEAMAAATGRRF
jgi:hypothetical protein